ncbi:type II toxin-antitoxin system HicB family antitoxin [Moraxella catarrhalis]|uniref:type II toxin-antitoxin system HicB family antitoxin n=1 Tax=Moraxella catarrhalis TaxID=480 RepID=UPI001EEEBE14|nr:type II toxin-antitoxin system HicB family antitoxin [Moraxella catarrhalis]
MLYPIAILKGGDKTAHGIFFPDVPNLASACDELQDIHKMALECLDVHFSGLVADGEEISHCLPILMHTPKTANLTV